jgi:hypothetical protein
VHKYGAHHIYLESLQQKLSIRKDGFHRRFLERIFGWKRLQAQRGGK